jgi:hypothetical protein
MTDEQILNELRSQRLFWLSEASKRRVQVGECESQVAMYDRLLSVFQKEINDN